MDLNKLLHNILSPEKVKTSLTDRYSYASDASFYYLIPQAVVQPANLNDVKALFALSEQTKPPWYLELLAQVCRVNLLLMAFL